MTVPSIVPVADVAAFETLTIVIELLRSAFDFCSAFGFVSSGVSDVCADPAAARWGLAVWLKFRLTPQTVCLLPMRDRNRESATEQTE